MMMRGKTAALVKGSVYLASIAGTVDWYGSRLSSETCLIEHGKKVVLKRSHNLKVVIRR